MRVFLSLLVFIFFLGSVQAETVHRKAPANKASVVGGHSTFQIMTCTAGAIPRLKVGKKPKNGTVTFRQNSYKLGKDAGRCEGKNVKGMLVVYKPNRGFRGKDVFRVDFPMHRHVAASRPSNVSYKYVIEVK